MILLEGEPPFMLINERGEFCFVIELSGFPKHTGFEGQTFFFIEYQVGPNHG